MGPAGEATGLLGNGRVVETGPGSPGASGAMVRGPSVERMELSCSRLAEEEKLPKKKANEHIHIPGCLTPAHSGLLNPDVIR